MRNMMVTVLDEDYITVAQAKGLPHAPGDVRLRGAHRGAAAALELRAVARLHRRRHAHHGDDLLLPRTRPAAVRGDLREGLPAHAGHVPRHHPLRARREHPRRRRVRDHRSPLPSGVRQYERPQPASPRPSPSAPAVGRFASRSRCSATASRSTGSSSSASSRSSPIFGPWIAPYDPDAIDLLHRNEHADRSSTGSAPPTWARTSSARSSSAPAASWSSASSPASSRPSSPSSIGVTAGYITGGGSEALSALTNVFLVIPALPLIIIVASQFEDPSIVLIATVLAITGWAWGARVLRAQTMSLRNRDFIQAARVNGEPLYRIIAVEMLPNLMAVIASSFVGTVTAAILAQTTLAFVGVTPITQLELGHHPVLGAEQQRVPRQVVVVPARRSLHRARRHGAGARQLRHRRVRQSAPSQCRTAQLAPCARRASSKKRASPPSGSTSPTPAP